ncbi:Hsp70 protein [Alkalispirochaeta americana]|uniref:Hsp70 protein n=1 Tax=Alkalispirochaeta americana TaxID=159291 RepID=A0A1N6XHM1_9SPIO|nr:LysM peptidoglycan-binding domain-containing protein [Alkalispirochaeta americana]SIR01858.1 Hsp70 protein [Alkalispirochaeta americana]
MIGVRLADRSFYPVFDGQGSVRKKLVLTTVRDEQDRAEISLYRVFEQQDPGFKEQSELQSEEFLGTVALTNLSPQKQGTPDLDLLLTLDDEGVLHVVATDRQGGGMQSLVIPLEDRRNSSPYQRISEGDRDFLDEPEDDSGFDEDPRHWEPSPGHRSGRLVLVLLFALLIVLLFAAATLVFRSFAAGDAVEPTPVEQPPDPHPPQEAAPFQEPEHSGEQEPLAREDRVEPAKEAKEAEPSLAEGGAVREDTLYQISWGDTLWDLSLRFYGTPWRFLEIADKNRIRDPDVIFADQDLLIPKR